MKKYLKELAAHLIFILAACILALPAAARYICADKEKRQALRW